MSEQTFRVTSCGALPPYSVTYVDPEVCATSQPQWFVMGTVDGTPGNGCGPVAICEYEPSAHVIAALLNAHNGCIASHVADHDESETT